MSTSNAAAGRNLREPGVTAPAVTHRPTSLPAAMFTKVLVANRGEIAVRVIRALEELGIGSVAVYSELDRDALHVRRAGEAYLLGGAPPTESYLNVERILQAARESGAEAIHPGYGFLAENAAFARACDEAGIVFIGPPASAIDAMGSKTRARELMREAGVPIVPGTTAPVATVDDARAVIDAEIGYPVAVKAAGGGGGKGFRVAQCEAGLRAAFEGAAREGEKFFSDPTVYLERYLPDPRHVEVQVLADRHGHVIHLGERDCSVQRRHQKLIEESPAPVVDAALRERIGRIGVEAARAVGYAGAGTIEGLLSDEGDYFFLEMNTRVQVEHCVTEMTTGVDIVKEGIRAAAGKPLSVTQEDVVLRGHAIECRINAEDASRKFAPAPGRIGHYREPTGPGVRVDSGVGPGSEISPMYDPMVAKLIVWDADREQATRRMLRALGEYEIEGLKTLIPFHRALLATEQWARGETCRDLLEDAEWLKALAFPAPAGGGAEPDEEAVEREYTVEVSGRRFDVKVIGPPGPAALNGSAPAATAAAGARPRPRRAERAGGRGGGGSGDALVSPLQGNMWKVLVEQGQTVEEGQLVCIIEAMKMENEITAHKAGVVSELAVREGEPITSGATIAVISSA
jgi:acetyl-CoA/propionyl-CoA carboxylase biotin carboxyl carrier protein